MVHEPRKDNKSNVFKVYCTGKDKKYLFHLKNRIYDTKYVRMYMNI